MGYKWDIKNKNNYFMVKIEMELWDIKEIKIRGTMGYKR